jgi:8-oxo-dGTP diphosphatase
MSRVQVAVGVIWDDRHRVLISKRHTGSHQGGLWEFPGGKLEAGEDVVAALRRELHEELGIVIGAVRPLLEICHDYADKRVQLDVWHVLNFRGVAQGREGQAMLWVPAAELPGYEFPAANGAIVDAVVETGVRPL